MNTPAAKIRLGVKYRLSTCGIPGPSVKILSVDMVGSTPVLALISPGSYLERLDQFDAYGRGANLGQLVESMRSATYRNVYPNATFGAHHTSLRQAAFARSKTRQRVGILELIVEDGTVAYKMHPDFAPGTEPRE